MRKLEFSNRSLKEIRIIVDYLNSKWSEKTSKKFLNKLKENIDLIQINPELFPVSEFEELRKCVVSKQTTVFFIIEKNKVYIVSVFDTRQNPNKIKE
ncbi:type II toxin-antitoxin system RelE/ParE family toxin [Flavobacterium sp. F372]|uniref:Type II toxin-antitoxin system RelE/ParE family toxin n=1 Tax=Flavobacterium bernardetii TaxID=2813823 RepID=A0ABR7J1M6_9FLAO|nr:type II toxin-antitoxin system RelE/ParE family toxin [Flavobacterium bernardetii]MBC5835744.1 type II toxin-antitoxin system RelE/ParE family toxin [Flavobacterium bernardetii]NHF69475.1 type II toxin-antitoxin system RelE/ParE family toxin [Flavobacterium bernardetii]